MSKSFGKLLLGPLTALAVASIAMIPVAEAARGGGGGGGGGARAGAGGQTARADNSRADVRTNDVRNTSVNNVNVSRNVNVDVDRGWDRHPGAAVAVVGAAIAVGSTVAVVPAGCVPVNYAGVLYQQCGTTWYQAQGSQYVVVNPPY